MCVIFKNNDENENDIFEAKNLLDAMIVKYGSLAIQVGIIDIVLIIEI